MHPIITLNKMKPSFLGANQGYKHTQQPIPASIIAMAFFLPMTSNIIPDSRRNTIFGNNYIA